MRCPWTLMDPSAPEMPPACDLTSLKALSQRVRTKRKLCSITQASLTLMKSVSSARLPSLRLSIQRTGILFLRILHKNLAKTWLTTRATCGLTSSTMFISPRRRCLKMIGRSSFPTFLVTSRLGCSTTMIHRSRLICECEKGRWCSLNRGGLIAIKRTWYEQFQRIKFAVGGGMSQRWDCTHSNTTSKN